MQREPLVKGGQGRSHEEVEEACWVFLQAAGVVGGVLVLGLLVFWILQLCGIVS